MPRRDDARYVEFVAASQQRLRRTAYLMTGDWATAHDVVQEALIRVYVAWPRLERGAGLPAYAKRALVSAVVDHHRKGSRREAREERALLVDRVHDGSDQRADRQLLMAALATLPQRQRACVVLRYFEDLSVADTARALDCSTGNVKSLTSHGLATLRRHLTEAGHPDLLSVHEGEAR